MKLTMPQVNELTESDFARVFGGVFEHSPWVAEQAAAGRPYASLRELHEAMLRLVREAPGDAELALIRAHPNLATRLAVGEYSAREQQGVGLDKLSPEAFVWFTSMNDAYMAKFGFPFIFAVRGGTRADIEAAMTERIGHTAEEERAQAMREIVRITGLRLDDLIET